MRGFVPEYDLVTANNLNQALDYLSQGRKPFAGGTDLMVVFEAGKLKDKSFVSILNIPEFKNIRETSEQIEIGSCVTYSEIQNDPIIKKEFPLLVKSAWVTGAKAIQNRGTIGGNIANMSPAADTPPCLLVYEAELKIVGKNNSRIIPYKDFHKGYKQSDLKSDELIQSIILKRNNLWTHDYYHKVGTRSFQAISKTALAAVAIVENKKVIKYNMALASVAAYPLLLKEDYTQGDVLTLLKKEITPHTDIRSTSEYRLKVTANLITDFLRSLK
jgi:CO/xanthine dehydrogenase FAD-binding subunit